MGRPSGFLCIHRGQALYEPQVSLNSGGGEGGSAETAARLGEISTLPPGWGVDSLLKIGSPTSKSGYLCGFLAKEM